jgi:hypothetical protein
MPLHARPTPASKPRSEAAAPHRRGVGPHMPSGLSLTAPGDRFEREADRAAAQVMHASAPGGRRACACGGGCPRCSSREAAGGAHVPALPSGSPLHDTLRAPGQALDSGTRAFMEPRFGHDFGGVRVHADRSAAASARALQARAFTLGNRIVFGEGQFAPGTAAGRQLIAHELAHVLQQGSSSPMAMREALPQAEPDEDLAHQEGFEAGGIDIVERSGPRLARDLAIPPTVADAPEPVLNDAQLQAAIRYNGFRFKDPYSIAIVRDLVGVPRFPAVSDEDLARAVARYQADFGLRPDGQAGPATTRRLTAELRAEDLPEDARQLRRDNYVSWTPSAGTHNGCGAAPDASGLATFFQWDVNFNTSLRNGWLIQEIVNTRTRSRCDGTAIAETLTPRYWEAWWVDGSGDVRLPTAINASRTAASASVATAPADDLWRRASAAPSQGNWRMRANLFTALRLPNGFAVGNVADALALPSTAAAPGSDELGIVEASRGAAGRWNCCGPAATHFHNP